MKTKNSVLMQQARETLGGKWKFALGVFFLYIFVMIAVQSVPKGGPLLALVIDGPMMLGAAIFSLAFSRKENPHMEQMFDGFKRFGTALATYLLITLYTLFWALLLIVPGIMKALSYSMSFFILADDAHLSPTEAMEKSSKMMDGNKWKLFCLSLRFFGWFLVSLVTLGIGFLWLVPYVYITTAKFYDDIKNMDLAVVSA